MADPTTPASAGWPDVALWVLEHDGVLWAVIFAVVLLFFWKFADNVRACGEQVDGWHRRRMERNTVEHDRALERGLIISDIRSKEIALHMELERPSGIAQGERNAS